MIDQGKYMARCKEFEFGQSSKGTEFVRLHFQITQGEEQGKTVRWDGYFTEKTTQRTLDALETCGWDCGSVTELKGVTDNEVEIEVTHEKYNDNTYARVAWVNNPGSGGVKKSLEVSGLKGLEKRLQADIIERRQKKQQADDSVPWA